MLKMGTEVIAFDQCHGVNYSRIAIKLGLVAHGQNQDDERSRYKHTLAHCQQVEELTTIKGQLGVSELVLCRRASNGDLVDVSRTWVFSICCCPHGSRKSNPYTDSVGVLDGVSL